MFSYKCPYCEKTHVVGDFSTQTQYHTMFLPGGAFSVNNFIYAYCGGGLVELVISGTRAS